MLLFLLLILSTCFSDIDSGLYFLSESGSQYLKWRIEGNDSTAKESSLYFSKDAAISGKTGLGIRCGFIYAPVRVSTDIPKIDTLWSRFYIRLDSTNLPKKEIGELNKIFLISLFLNEIERSKGQLSFMLFAIQNSSFTKECSLAVAIQPSIHEKNDLNFTYSLSPGKIYCIESSIKFFSGDSVSVELFIDGNLMWKEALTYVLPRNFIKLVINNTHSGFRVWSVSIDEFAVANKQLYPLPVAPQNCRISNDSQVVLFCDKFKSAYSGEYHWASEWQLFRIGDAKFPLFAVRERDPFFAEHCIIPFQLDTGKYYSQVRFQNNYGNWSNWNTSDTIYLSTLSRFSARIMDLYLTDVKSGKTVTEITRDQWYHANILLDTLVDWQQTGYLIINLHHQNYPFGSPIEKGGAFLRDSNYVFNLSLLNGSKALYQKITEGSKASQSIPLGETGLYVDGNREEIVVDTVKNVIRLKIKLLAEAATGPWGFRAYFFDKNKSISNIFSRSIIVRHLRHSKTNRFVAVTAGLFAISIAAVLFYLIRLNGKKSKQKSAKEFLRIKEYLLERIHEKNSTDDVQKALKISRNNFFQIMRDNGTDYSKLLNLLRIKKAKELLVKTDKNISEICFEVGFSNPAYFIKVFRECENITPGDYAKRYKNLRINTA